VALQKEALAVLQCTCSTMPFSLAQQRTLALLPKITGFLSFMGSALIVFTVVRDEKKRNVVYHRLLCGLSVVDISASFWLALSTWPVPKDSGVVWAVGTTQTCTLQGFFTQFGISSSFYNASLSTYYLLVIRYGWKEHQIKRIEPYLHAAPCLWAGCTAIAGLPLKLFNNANLWCWIAPLPSTCVSDPAVDCIRGHHAEIYRWAFFYGPLWIMISIVTFNMIVLLLYVRKLERRSNVYSFSTRLRKNEYLEQRQESQWMTEIAQRLSSWMGASSQDNIVPEGVDQGNGQENEDDVPDAHKEDKVHIPCDSNAPAATQGAQSQSSSASPPRPDRRPNSGKRTREVAHQSFLYAGALYFTWIPLTVRPRADENSV
jgi:hypothetical protein